jgi:Zn-dependent protease
MQRKVSNGISTTTAIQTATSSQPFDLTHRHGERHIYRTACALLFLVAFFATSVIRTPSHFGTILGVTLLVFLFIGTSVLFHEFGHAVMALRRGLRVYRIVLGIYFGYTVRERSSNPKDDLLVAMAGPAASLLLALLGLTVFYANNLQISALFSS